MITYKITIDHTKISANLINFPIMLVLSHMPDVVYPAKVQITANGVQCYAEVSAGCLWVNVPVISSTVDTIIYLDYDPTWVNNTVYIGVTGTAPAQNVWDVNFMAVLHLVEQGNGTVGEYKDSTNRKHHGTAGSGYYGIAGSGAPSRVIDELGIAVNMFAGDGVNRSSEIDIPSSPDLSIPVPGGFTVEGCLSPNSDTFTATGTEHSTPWLSKGPYDINNNVHVEYDQFINDKLHPKPNWCTFYVCSPSGGLCAGSLTTGDIPTNSWLHLVGIASCTDSAHGTNQEFRNGVPFQTSIADWATGNGGAVIQYVPGTAPVKIGCWDAANEKFWFPGRIKEVRISNIARSTAWITATYATEFDNLVSFEEILSGFQHGTTHAASFQITENPYGKSCQFEFWLGPNPTTKIATAGKVNFTSGASVPVSCSITMPAAGTYNVYVDVYMLGVLIDKLVASSTVTVI